LNERGSISQEDMHELTWDYQLIDIYSLVKNLIFCLKLLLFFYIFLDHFDVLVLKIKKYFNIFSNKKHIKK
jgi:hypothetical protein